MLSMGEAGYLQATAAILETAAAIRTGIETMADLAVIGDPLWVIAFRSDTVNIYEVMAQMALRGWSLNGLHHPPALHLAVTLRHTRPGVSEKFLADLRDAVATARDTGEEAATGTAPLYGMAATFPARGAVSDLMERYIDRLYEVDDSP
jgi:glutamate/tyrosine decarboxylase-like PLP-dependent enzyme